MPRGFEHLDVVEHDLHAALGEVADGGVAGAGAHHRQELVDTSVRGTEPVGEDAVELLASRRGVGHLGDPALLVGVGLGRQRDVQGAAEFEDLGVEFRVAVDQVFTRFLDLRVRRLLLSEPTRRAFPQPGEPHLDEHVPAGRPQRPELGRRVLRTEVRLRGGRRNRERTDDRQRRHHLGETCEHRETPFAKQRRTSCPDTEGYGCFGRSRLLHHAMVIYSLPTQIDAVVRTEWPVRAGPAREVRLSPQQIPGDGAGAAGPPGTTTAVAHEDGSRGAVVGGRHACHDCASPSLLGGRTRPLKAATGPDLPRKHRGHTPTQGVHPQRQGCRTRALCNLTSSFRSHRSSSNAATMRP